MMKDFYLFSMSFRNTYRRLKKQRSPATKEVENCFVVSGFHGLTNVSLMSSHAQMEMNPLLEDTLKSRFELFLEWTYFLIHSTNEIKIKQKTWYVLNTYKFYTIYLRIFFFNICPDRQQDPLSWSFDVIFLYRGPGQGERPLASGRHAVYLAFNSLDALQAIFWVLQNRGLFCRLCHPSCRT